MDKGKTTRIMSGGAYIGKDGKRHEWRKIHGYKPKKITDDNWMEYGMPADEETNESKAMNKKLIRLTESDLHRIVKESVNKILNEVGIKAASDDIIANMKESAHDYWEDAIYNYETRERLPKGWEKIERDDDEPLYIDLDGNEYVKNEYGRFIPFGEYR